MVKGDSILKSIDQLKFYNGLYRIRIEHNKTASEVAAFLGITRMQYYRYERDLCPVPVKVVIALSFYYPTSQFSLYYVE